MDGDDLPFELVGVFDQVVQLYDFFGLQLCISDALFHFPLYLFQI